MTFYEAIAAHYHEIFPVKPAPLHLLQHLAGDAGSQVLDIACGTGEYAAAMARAGYKVYACDLDPEMARRAGEKKQVYAFQADMLMLTEHKALSGRLFDLVYCIGNSLVHLPDEEAVGKALREMHKLLKPGGHLVLQIINYDRILDQHIDSLPSIVNKETGLVFTRDYEVLSDARIAFTTTLTVSGENDDKPRKQTVTLLPLRSQVLRKVVSEAGFYHIETFGNFMLSPFEENHSQPLVLTAKK